MSTYLLTCECGKNVPVEIGQAGGRVACSCGAQLQVPPLRKLRHLPVATPKIAPSQAAWNPRKGIVAAGLIMAVLLACVALGSRVTEPTVPEFDPVGRLNAVDEGLKSMTPIESWRLWVEIYRPLADSGFAVFQHPHAASIEQQIAERRFLQKTLLILAGICAAVAVAAAFWPRPTTRRLAATR